MPEALAVLLDQNVPRAVAAWLRARRPSWMVFHASEVGLDSQPDQRVFLWAQERRAVIVTFDEDFGDIRSFPVGTHHGIVRLRIWPTTIEETEDALGRLIEEVDETELAGALVIVGRSRIRIRPRR